ncbi:helix-hairpin-helix domain-containing protein [Nocardioides currus]|uniref:Helix-hairpin-helix DNA-binding motif class 1 domain-containing protein n=1 Tax=Nocardioides currus TaxID=2133958 RepID=A0A2R7YVF5_9ACTN|nr:helix-hairpin-helix domain-containing protein [Nocardioides currus]PUA80390.1 hypothetical protein C7S10_14805 [Nocardioides currus]
MRPIHPRSTTSDEHAEAVSRRLATLSAELAAVRGDPPLAHRHTQVRGLNAAPDPDPDPAPVVPIPGRHSTRRPGTRGWASRIDLTATHVAAIAVVIALAVGVAAWFAVRSAPEPVPDLAPVAEPLTSVSPPASSGATAGPSASSSPDAVEVTIDVAGKVRRPGIAVLPAGSRVVDALEAAGGARRGVDLSSLNLARPLVDGEQVLVGVPLPPGVVGSVGATPGPGDSGPLVNINTADLTALESLPGVGPVTAEAIVSWRTEHGGFTSVEELLEVDGIGDATLAEIAPHATI